MLLIPMDYSSGPTLDEIVRQEDQLVNETADTNESFSGQSSAGTDTYQSEELTGEKYNHIYQKIPTGIQEINITELQFLKIVGKGSFGVVYKAFWAVHSIIVAVKKVETDSELSAFENETQQLSRVSHENIIQMFGIATELSSKCLVMEFADGGSLSEFLHSPPYSRYSLSHALSWLLQCAKAIAYLHAFKPIPIVHRDLKPLNMLLTNNKTVLKICDFGTACTVRIDMTDNRGSTAWMAPEVMRGSKYSEKCDVYSWGMILWELLTRRIPFKEWGLPCRILWQVVNDVRPPPIQDCPKPIESLMKRCWMEENIRPTMLDVIEVISPIYKFINNGDEFVHYSSSSESFTESCVSPLNDVSSGGHTSQDVSEFPSSTNTLFRTGDSPREPCLATPVQDDSVPSDKDDFVIVPFPATLKPIQKVHTTSNVLDINRILSPQKVNVPKPSFIAGASIPSPVRRSVPASLDQRVFAPLTIEIPHPGFPTRDDVIADISHVHSIGEHLSPQVACSPSITPAVTATTVTFKDKNAIPLRRQNLAVNPSETSIRRRSAEVTDKTNYKGPTPVVHHKRASSYDSKLIGFELISRDVRNESSIQELPANYPPPPTSGGEVDRRIGGGVGGGGGDQSYSRPDGASGVRLPQRYERPYLDNTGNNNNNNLRVPVTTSTTTSSHHHLQAPPSLPPLLPSSSTTNAPQMKNEQQLDLLELLDDEFKPTSPLPNNSHSQQIFNDHRGLAHQLLVVQEEIVFLDQKKNNLLKRISDQDREQSACKERYNDTIKQLEQENDDYMRCYSRISQQVEEIRRARQQPPQPSPPPSYFQPSPPRASRPPVPSPMYPNFYDHQTNPHLGHQ